MAVSRTFHLSLFRNSEFLSVAEQVAQRLGRPTFTLEDVTACFADSRPKGVTATAIESFKHHLQGTADVFEVSVRPSLAPATVEAALELVVGAATLLTRPLINAPKPELYWRAVCDHLAMLHRAIRESPLGHGLPEVEGSDGERFEKRAHRLTEGIGQFALGSDVAGRAVRFGDVAGTMATVVRSACAVMTHSLAPLSWSLIRYAGLHQSMVLTKTNHALRSLGDGIDEGPFLDRVHETVARLGSTIGQTSQALHRTDPYLEEPAKPLDAERNQALIALEANRKRGEDVATALEALAQPASGR
jgi:hypothetical protein